MVVLDEYGEGESITGTLTDDTLLQIFEHISTRELLTLAAFVCRRWKRLSQSQIRELWSVFDPLSVERARNNASTITSIHFPAEYFSLINGQEIVSIVSFLNRLRHLSICVEADFPLPLLAEAVSPQLQSLTLDTFAAVEIDVSSILDTLSLRCPRLWDLRLHGFGSIHRQVLQNFSPSLTSLHITGSYLSWRHIDEIFQSCSKLSELCLNAIHGLPNYYTFSQMPPCLKSLRLSSFPRNSIAYDHSRGWKLIRDQGGQLEALYANGTFSASWQAISRCCGNLKVLDLWSPAVVAVSSELEEKALCEIPSLLRKLEKVRLPGASDKVLAQFGRFASQLRELEVRQHSKTFNVTDRGINSLVEGCNKLEVLALLGCTMITISSMRFLAFHCPELRVLDLFGCKLIDDKAIAVLFPRLSISLQELCIDCGVSGATLELLEKQASSLRRLTITRPLRGKLNPLIEVLKKRRPWLNVTSRREDDDIVMPTC